MVAHEWLHVTSWLLVDERLRRIPARHWALEAALGRLRDHESASHFEGFESWASPSPLGWRFRRLSEVVWALVHEGALVISRRIDGGTYIIDPWWQSDRRAELMTLPAGAKDGVASASSYLASLLATPATASKRA